VDGGVAASRPRTGPSLHNGYAVVPTTVEAAQQRVEAARRAAQGAQGAATAAAGAAEASTSRRSTKAASFAALVRRELSPAAYAEFLRIVKAHRAKELSGDAMVAETTALFVNKSGLLAGFLDFLPDALRERHRSSLERQIARARFGDPQLRSRSLAPRAKPLATTTTTSSSATKTKTTTTTTTTTTTVGSSSSSRLPDVGRRHVKLVPEPEYHVVADAAAGPPPSSATGTGTGTNTTGKVPALASEDDEVPVGAIVCLVCSGVATGPSVSACGHVACRGCWDEWLAMSLSCPACSTRVRVKMLRDLRVEDTASRPRCVACKDSTANKATTALPCGHVGCSPCVTPLRTCPGCEQRVTASVQLRRVYL